MLVLSATLPLPVLLILAAAYFHLISQSMTRQLGAFIPFLGFVLGARGARPAVPASQCPAAGARRR